MRNILQERPAQDPRGTSRFATHFVDDADLQNRRILDIGCGYGGFLLHAVQRGVESAAGLEPSEQAIATARAHVRDSKVALHIGSAIRLPFEDGEFDTVSAWEVIEHIPKQTEPRMFAEVFRILRPGGAFYLSTPHRSIRSNALDPAWWLIGHRHYSVDALEAFGRRAGFDLMKSDVRGGWWLATQINNMYISKWILRRRTLFADWFDSRVEAEIARGPGFYDLFAKFIKPRAGVDSVV
ncbi:class I SAM-dependent methyltransferase [Pendulispora albinea]|uniref:Methyltransferase domain-containing protein n=1 Tax=Pendulispora albinea TaxID=2741071 RepID=A0ABZ2LUG8_9BACT